MDTTPHYLKKEVDDRIRDGQSILFEFLEHGSLDGIWYRDLEHPSNEWMSPQFWLMLGYDPAEKKHLAAERQDLMHPDDLKVFTDNLENHCADANHSFDLVVRYRHKNGSIVWLRCRGVAIRDETGKPIRMLGAYTDLTAQKRVEEMLRGSNKKYREMAGRIPGMIYQFVLHKDGSYSVPYISDKVFDYSGYTPEQMMADPSLIFKPIHPEDLDAVLAEMRRSAKTLTAFEVEHRLVTSNGEIKYLDAKASPRRLDSGDILWDGISIDVTDRKLAQEAGRENEERFRAAFMGNPHAVVISTFYEGVWVDLNQAALEMFGYTREEIIGKSSLSTDLWVDISDRQKIITALGRDQEIKNQHIRLRHKDGRIITASLSARTLVLKGENHILFIAEDITARKMAEAALKAERDLMDRIMVTSPAGIVLVDSQGYIRFANNRAEQIMGLQVNDSMTRAYNDPKWKIRSIDGEPFPEDRLPYNIVKQTGKPVHNVQHAIEHPDGRFVLLSVNATPLFQTSGAFDGLVATIEDNTGRFRAEQNYQMLFREMLEGFALHEIIYNEAGQPVDYRFLAVNPAFERITGLRAESLIGKTVLEVLPATEPYWIEKYGRVALTGEPDTFENFSREVGRYFQVTAFRYAKNQFACIVSDITERRKADEERKKLQTQLSNAVELAHLGHWEYDVANDLFTFNDQFYKIFHTTAEEVGGYTMPSAEYARRFVHPDDLHVVGEEIEKAIQAADPHFKGQLEHRIVYADGGIGHISVQHFVERGADGRTVRTYGVNQDITDRKRIEERLRQAQKMESIGNLAGGIAHDFNNILFPIVGMAEMLLEDLPVDSPEYENAQEILNAGKRGSDLVKQILAFSRQSEHKMIPVRIQQVLKEVLKLIRATIPSNIEIVQDIQTDCGLVLADPIQIHQVAMNLITNAYHAAESKAGQIVVGLKAAVLDGDAAEAIALEPGAYAILTISDNGAGMDHATMNKIFEPYFTTKERGKGTGLGLAVVYGIVKEHNGEIKVYSEAGEGTTFNVYFPLIKRPSKTEKPSKAGTPQTGTERILLVDDEEPIVRLEKQMLERLGYQVTERTSSTDALKAFMANPTSYDLVISDMTMPNMTGDQLARELRAINARVPIIICTGFSERINKEKAEAAGIKALLMKPIVRSELARMVRKVLDEAKDENQ